jgi:iron(III) transport system ATP-binding protein
VYDSASRVNVPPDKRRIGMVFQSYALWPHMTVRKNIGYPLKAQRMKAAINEGRIEQTARIVECDTLLDRYPMQLSGGQQQRVALARALVARPEVILFDEPLSNLDARLRDQMRTEIHELHQSNRFTAIFVTHDQTEALALGQRIAIMRAGSIEQLDTPERVFEHPATEYVAAFIGLSNRLLCDLVDGEWMVGGQRLTGAPFAPGWRGRTVIRFGPDNSRLVQTTAELAPDEACVAAKAADVEFAGTHMNLTVQIGETRARARMLCGSHDSWIRHIAPGDQVHLAFSPSRVSAYRAAEDAVPLTLDDPALPEVAGV